ncbi:MAG: hypothetical protein ACI82A_004094 [Candidatus Azotimanducaceae bacterium]|jgi:hypothetical protein
MIADHLVFYAIAIFILMAIGLIFTIIEFRNMSTEQQQDERSRKSERNGTG